MKKRTIQVRRHDVGKAADVEIEVFEDWKEAVQLIGAERALRCLNYGYCQYVRGDIWRELGKGETLPPEILKIFREKPAFLEQLIKALEEN